MTKKVIICFVLCCILVAGVACPVYAQSTEVAYNSDEWVYCVQPMHLDLDYYPPEDDGWGGFSLSAQNAWPLSIEAHSQVLIAVDAAYFICELQTFTYPDGESYYYYGNLALFEENVLDTGEPFLFLTDVPPSFVESNFPNLSPLPDIFYSTLLLDGEVDSVIFSVSVVRDGESVELPVAVGSGFGAVLRWCGSVVNALISPDGALFALLPVIGMAVGIPLVAWGIKKFKDCTWGF